MNRLQLIEHLATHLRTPTKDIVFILLSAPHRYFHYQIEKKTGGMRDIYHPTPELKSIQRWIVDECLSRLPVHESVYSYVRGKSISMHARMHLQSNYFLRLDFNDFFPSITSDVISEYLINQNESGQIDLERDAIESIVRFVCCAGANKNSLALSIGAPSSPMLSNCILMDLDHYCTGLAKNNGCVYTRYSDDIYFSTQNRDILGNIEAAFRDYLKTSFPFLSLNDKKVMHLSRKRKVVVTGLTISSDRNVSLGRETKRRLKTEVFLYLKGDLPPEKIESLRGYLAFAKDAEPDFHSALERKFGEKTIAQIFQP